MEVKADLLAAFKAKLPGVHLRTLEEGRAINALRLTVKEISNMKGAAPRTLQRWSAASGLVKLDTTSEDVLVDKPLQEQCALDEALGAFQKSDEKNLVLALLDPWDELNRPLYQRFVREALQHARATGKVLIFVGRDWKIPQELQADVFLCDLYLPTRSDLEEFIRAKAVLFTEKLPGRVTIDEKALPDLARACTGLTLDETTSIISLSLVRFRGIGQEAVRLAIKEKRQIVSRTGILEYEEPERGMADVGGLQNVKTWLTKRGKLFSDAARKAGIKAPKGILLAGLPGVGKTLIARAVAAAWNQPLLRLDAGKLFGSLVGESESNLRQALRTAEAVAPCVLLIDEIEKGFGQAGAGGGGDGGTSQRVFGALLTWMQDKKAEVFVVGTSNNLDKLDPALIRRFDCVFATDLPDEAARAEILHIHLSRAGLLLGRGTAGYPVATISALAARSKGFTGAELETAVQAGLIDAFDAGRAPDQVDFERAINATVPLAKTMADQLKSLREFCKSGRAVPAGLSIEADEARAQAQGPSVEL